MSNTTLIIGAIVLVLVIAAIFILTRKPAAQLPLAQPQAKMSAPASAAQEGHSLTDSAVAAVLDVTGPVVGVDLHPDLPSDDLTRIKGLGPKAQTMLNSVGIHRYSQLAALDPAQAGEVDARMGTFKGRIHRDQWVDQARFLEQDDTAGFEAKYGKLG